MELRSLFFAGALCLTMSAGLAQSHSKLAVNRDDLSYSLGVMTAATFKSHDVSLSDEAFSQGFSDVMNNQPLRISMAKVKTTVASFQQNNQVNQSKRIEREGDAHQSKQAAFLEKNKQKPAVKQTASGLQYKILTPGQGARPQLTDRVAVDYEGRLLTGEIFDSSYQRGQSVTFSVGAVIKGWQEALQLMKPGATWMLYIPSDLAYGTHNVPGIGPNQLLIFKVHLIAVNPVS